MNRFDDALAIQSACNPSGVARSVVAMLAQIISEENGDTNSMRNDPAVRLAVYQLAYLTGATDANYSEAYSACETLRRNHEVTP